MNQMTEQKKVEAVLEGIYFRTSDTEMAELEKVHSLEYMIENDTMVLVANAIISTEGNTTDLLDAINDGHKELVLVGRIGEEQIEMTLTDFRCRLQGRFPIETITFETKNFTHWKPFQIKEN